MSVAEEHLRWCSEFPRGEPEAFQRAVGAMVVSQRFSVRNREILNAPEAQRSLAPHFNVRNREILNAP